MSKRHHSLAGALYRRIVFTVAVVGLAMAVATLAAGYRAIGRDSDADLVTAADVLFALMRDQLSGTLDAPPGSGPIDVDQELPRDEQEQTFNTSADLRMFLVFRDGRPIMRSDTAPNPASIPRQPGFQDFRVNGERWRSYGLAVPGNGLLVVGERLDARYVVIREIVAELLLPFLALLPVTAILLHLSLRSGLASLHRLSDILAERSPHDLSPLDHAAWPRDLAALIESLNRLFGRVEEALAREQGFTDDAAHQLRTPLAAIRIQAQTVVSALPASEAASARALLDGVERASALVDRMLELSRLEAMAVERAPIELRSVVASIVAGHALLAAHKDVEFELVSPAEVVGMSDPAILAIALAAVVENAVKHAPRDSAIVIRIAPDAAGGAVISVTDQGRGVPVSERDRLFDRFARGSTNEAGTGLGLAIARRAMTLLGGSIAFADADHGGEGLTVLLAIPA